MLMASICELMGWGYDQYMSQPRWFISLLETKTEIDAKRVKDKIKGLG